MYFTLAGIYKNQGRQSISLLDKHFIRGGLQLLFFTKGGTDGQAAVAIINGHHTKQSRQDAGNVHSRSVGLVVSHKPSQVLVSDLYRGYRGGWLDIPCHKPPDFRINQFSGFAIARVNGEKIAKPVIRQIGII